MKTLTTLLKRNWQICIMLISIVCTPGIAFAIEPIAKIGQPRPKQHAFLNNGTILRVVSSHIQVVDANTGEVVDEFGNLTYDSEVVFSPNAAHLAILNYSYETRKTNVEIWDANIQEKISVWQTESDIDRDAIFSPTTPLLVSYANNEIHLWNWKTGESLGKMIGERRPLELCYLRENGRTCGGISDRSSVFTLDGKYLIVASRRPDIEIWNVETRELEGHFEGHTGNWVDGVAISPDGKYIASFDRIAGFVYVWHTKAQHLLWKAKSAIGSVTTVTFSPDSQRLYVASRTGGRTKIGTNPWEGWDDRVRVWDVQSGQQVDMLETEFRSLW